jgi:NADH-quinone oxidoreductase subunit J
MKALLFLLLSLLTIGGALLVVARKSPVDSVLALLLVMLSLAGHYAMLGAPFLAAVQVIVYAGAVVVLFLFVIMLLNLRRDKLLARTMPPGRWRYALAGALLMVALSGLFRVGAGWLALRGVDGRIEPFGLELFQRWIWPFELVGVLLLAAIVGAVALTRRTEAIAPEAEEKA